MNLDIYMPDIKYGNPAVGKKHSKLSDYVIRLNQIRAHLSVNNLETIKLSTLFAFFQKWGSQKWDDRLELNLSV